MIVSACVNVQAGERGQHVGVSQVTHVHMQYEVVSLDPITEEMLSCGPMQLNYTYTQVHAHTSQTHTK